MSIRKMLFSDLEIITDIFIESYQKQPWSESWKRNDAFKRLNFLFSIPNSFCYVYEYKGSIVGAIFALNLPWHIGTQLEIREFFIQPLFQNKGIGKDMFKKIECIAKECGVKEITLSTKNVAHLVHFYKENKCTQNTELILFSKNI